MSSRTAPEPGLAAVRRADCRPDDCAGLQGLAPCAPFRAMQPDILFVMADQLRWDHLGCSSHPYIRTPVARTDRSELA